MVKDKPEANKMYKLTGGFGEKCIANGNSWSESECNDNLLLSCEAHGKETYFNIKKMEKKPSMRNYVYVWFKRKKQAEKMWVRILKGTQKEGLGKLDNIPAFLDHLKLGQTIKFKTDKEGITWQSI